MKTLLLLVLVLALGVMAGWYLARPGGDFRLEVLFRDRQGIEAGDGVYRGEERIGAVTRVAPDGNRVRATLRIDAAAAAKLPSRSTFQVRRKDGARRIEAHVLDPRSAPFASGTTVEGVGSSIELALRQGAEKVAAKVTEVGERAADSDWVREGKKKIEESRRKIEEIDWDAVGRDARGRARDVSDKLGELAGKSKEEARQLYERIRPEIERLLAELEALGRSDEAQALRRKVRDIFGTSEPLTPEAPEPATSAVP